MLEVELDIFSGMPNPTWVLSKRQEATLFEQLRAGPNQISPVTTPDEQFGLGYRGLIVRRIKSDEGSWDKAVSAMKTPFPNEFRIGSQPAASGAGSTQNSAADWLVKTAIRQGTGLTDEVREAIAQGVVLVPQSPGPNTPAAKITKADIAAIEEAEIATETPYKQNANKTARGATWWNCGSNYFNANADFFNDPAHVTRNNCYCFASNHRADVRYALPGKRIDV